MDPSDRHHESLYVGISGLIGAGKTTLAKALGPVMGLPVYCEEVDENPYLSDFYVHPEKYSFHLQIYLLNRRYRQQQRIIWRGEGAVQDRTIYEDRVFCKMLRDDGCLEGRDYDTYVALFENMANFMRNPSLIVHLDVSPEEAYRRVRLRARECEKTVPLDYLERLHLYYEEHIKEISKVIPVIRVDYSEFSSATRIASIIREKWKGMQAITMVALDE